MTNQPSPDSGEPTGNAHVPSDALIDELSVLSVEVSVSAESDVEEPHAEIARHASRDVVVTQLLLGVISVP